MAIEDPGTWVVIGSAVTATAAVFRPAAHIVIFFIAVRGAEPRERKEIIEALAKTRQFGRWSRPRRSVALADSTQADGRPEILTGLTVRGTPRGSGVTSCGRES